MQLRTLLMDEVPVIIHRLSQRLWVPEYREREEEEQMHDSATEEKPVDPLASPPQDPVDTSGNALNASQIASLSLDAGSEMHALFSQKNLLRLGALTDSHRTLSLFTPGIRDAVFRAWAGPVERGESHKTSGQATPITPAMIRANSFAGTTSTTYSFAETAQGGQPVIRPGLSSFGSAASGLGQGSSKHVRAHGARRKKHRVVNLRKKATNGDDLESVGGESSTASGTLSSTPSEFGGRPHTPENREKDELSTPPSTPEQPFQQMEPGDGTPVRLRRLTPRPPPKDFDATPRASMYDTASSNRQTPPSVFEENRPKLRPSHSSQMPPSSRGKGSEAKTLTPSSLQAPLNQSAKSAPAGNPSSSIMEQPWMAKMAGEIARAMQEQKAANDGFWDRNSRGETPPPAYGA